MLKEKGPIYMPFDKFNSGTTANVGCYKTPEHCNKQVGRQNSVKESDKILKIDWRKDLIL